MSIDASQNWGIDLAALVLDSKTNLVSGTCVGTIQSHGSQWSHNGLLTPHQMQTFLHQLRAFCDRSSLIQANDREYVCAQMAAPAASAYLGEKHLLLMRYRAALKQLEGLTNLSDERYPAMDVQYASDYERELRLQFQKFPFITVNGYIGIASPYIQEGDFVYIFPGYILRQHLESNRFSIVGAAHIHGLMNGEYFRTKGEVRRFALV